MTFLIAHAGASTGKPTVCFMVGDFVTDWRFRLEEGFSLISVTRLTRLYQKPLATKLTSGERVAKDI
jgi:hypothetical protein